MRAQMCRLTLYWDPWYYHCISIQLLALLVLLSYLFSRSEPMLLPTLLLTLWQSLKEAELNVRATM